MDITRVYHHALPVLVLLGLMACAPPTPEVSSGLYSEDVRELERKLDRLQQRQQEDREQWIGVVTRLQQQVEALEANLQREQEARRAAEAVLEARLEAGLAAPSVDGQPAPATVPEPDSGEATGEAPLRVTIRGDVRSLRDDFVDPPTGADADWFPLRVVDVRLVREAAEPRILSRFEPTGEQIRDEDGRMVDEMVRVEEQVAAFNSFVEATLTNRLKHQIHCLVQAGALPRRVVLGPAETRQIRIPGVSGTPLLVEHESRRRSYSVE